MSIYGIGARYGSEWMTDKFIDAGVAAIGFTEADAPEIFAQFRKVDIGDIMFMKAFGPNSSQLCIMGVGIVTDNDVVRINEELGQGIKVDWVFTDEYYIPERRKLGFDKHRNVRCGTLFEEHNREIKHLIIDILLNPDEYEEDDE